MSGSIIQTLWIGGSLSVMEQLCIASFIKNGHEFHLYTYGDVLNVPNYTVIQDANEIIPESEIFTYCNGSYAGFADWFRWALLCKKGNIWVDTDVICLKYFDFDGELLFGLESAKISCPAILGFPADHEICVFLESVCDNPNKFLPYDGIKIKIKKVIRKILNGRRSNIAWGETGGPMGFTKALEYFGILNQAKPFTYFFPIHYTSWDSVFDKTLANDLSLFSNTYAIHLWNEMSRNCPGFDKNASFPEDSLFEQLKTRYL